MISPLIWKEWHEQRWKLAFGTVMLLFFTGSFLAAKVTTQGELVVVIWVFGGLILSLYSAMGVFASESSNNTITFLASRPVKSWKVFACKWFFGWLNFVIPMFVCSLCLAVNILQMEPEYIIRLKSVIRGTAATVCMATMFYTMTCCLAKKRSSEAFVGFAGLVIFFFLLVHLMLVEVTIIMTTGPTDFSLFQQMVLFINPLFWTMLVKPLPHETYYGVLLIEQGLIFTAVVWIGLRKWQRSS